MNVVDFLLESPVDGSRNAVFHEKGTITHDALRHRVAAVAAWLGSTSFQPGDRCLLLADNTPFWIESYLGILKAGGTVVPVSPALGKAELAGIIAGTGPRVAFVQSNYRVRLDWPGRIISERGLDSIPERPMGFPVGTYTDFDDRRHLASLMFTSGSTGTPRGVMVTHRNIIANTASIVEYLHLTAEDRIMDVLPLCYCFGTSLLHTHLRVGGSIVLDNSFLFPDRMLANLNRMRCTGLAGVPATFQILLRKSSLKRMQFPSLRYVQQAGGKLADRFVDELRQALPGTQVYVMYGQTEATARLSYLPPEEYEARRGSVGRGIPGVRLRVVDATGQAVAVGAVGEIVAEGENITAGYWNAREETAAVFRDGRLYTGDLATVDADGFIYVVGRSKEFLKLGGYRVGCQQIENTVLNFSGIAEAAVIGVPDELQGEAVVLFVAHPKGESILEEMRAFCRERLPMQHRPRQIVVRRELPKNASGKLDRAALKRQWVG